MSAGITDSTVHMRFFPGVTLLGIPSEVYTYGSVYVWSCLAYYFSLPLVTFFFFPKYYDLNITSANEVGTTGINITT